MLMKKIGIYLSAIVMLAGMVACTNKEAIEGNGHGFDEATFSIETVSVENTTASFKITSTGFPGATYYGFLSADMESKASDVVDAKLSTINVTRHILSSGTNTVEEKGLRQGGKKYRYIVTGLLANGATYNEPVVADIATTGDYTTGSLAVSVASITAQTPVFSISGVDGKAAYAVVTKEVADSYSSNEKELFNALFDSIDDLAVIEADDANCKWSKLEPADYVVYAVGFKEDADALEGFQPTLKYAKAAFTVEPVKDPEAEYLAYIGTWYDADGNEYTIAQKDVNATFTMTGLDVDITVLYENKGIKFSGEEKLGETADGLEVYLFGLDQDGYAEDASQNEADPYILATGAIDGSNIAITGSEYQAVYSGTTYDEVICGLIVYGLDPAAGKLYKMAEEPAVLALPATLTKEKPGDNPGDDPYSKYLGDWTITRGEATDTWTISVKEDGKTYNIDGIEGSKASDGMTVEGVFEDGNLVVYTQTLGTWSHNSYGNIEDHLFGNIIYQGKKYYITGEYVAFTGVVSADGNSVELTPGKVNITDLGEFDVAGIQFYGILIDEGENKGKALSYTSDYTTLPNTLTKVGGEEESAYSKYLGDWNITRGEATDTWTISVKEDGKTYNIDGIEGSKASDGMTVEGVFEDGNLVVYTQTLGTWSHNSYGNIEDHLFGNIIYQGKKYYITGEYVAFTGVVSADGNSVELTPGKVNITDLGEFDVAGIQFYGILIDEGENKGKALSYTSDYTTLPNTLTAASGETSSVKGMDKEASAKIMSTLVLNHNGNSAFRTMSGKNVKTKGTLEKSSSMKTEKKDNGSAPKTRGSKTSRGSKSSSSIIAGHKA